MWEPAERGDASGDRGDPGVYEGLAGVLPIGRFADSDIAAEIADAGGRVLPPCEVRDGAARIETSLGARVVIAALAADDPAEARDALLAAIERQAAGSSALAAIVIVPPALIDVAAAALAADRIELLVDPDVGERRAALANALTPSATMLHDVGSEAAARGGALREEVARIARRLAAIAGSDLPTLRDRTNDYAGPAPHRGADAGSIRAMIRARRLRDQFFAPELFADPAWDMLLDLMAARLEGEEVAVSSLCIAAAVPPTTALRWIKTLSDAGLLVRRADPLDRRRVFIALGEQAAAAMERYLAALGRSGGGLVV